MTSHLDLKIKADLGNLKVIIKITFYYKESTKRTYSSNTRFGVIEGI